MKILKTLTLIMTLALLLTLTGCNGNLLIKNTTTEKVVPIFKEYVSMHGYQIVYSNESTGAYRIELGEVYIPHKSRTVATRSTVATSNLVSPLTSYEEQTWETISARDQKVLVAIMVKIRQKGNGVNIQVDADENYQPIYTQGEKLKKYFESYGYEVEFL